MAKLAIGAQGVDISHWQGEITPAELSRAAEDSIQFVYVKATEGTLYADQRFAENWKHAHAAQAVRLEFQRATSGGSTLQLEQTAPFLVGAYMFFRPDFGEGAKQADHFLDVLERQGLGFGALELMIDLEDPISNKQIVPLEKYKTTFLKTFYDLINRIAQRTEQQVGVYTRASYLDQLFVKPADADFVIDLPLWIANYPVVRTAQYKPRLPRCFHNAGKRARYWQYDNGRQRFSKAIDGLGLVDRNEFLG